MNWILENKDRTDKRHMTPISLGGGINMWLNDRWGIGLQASYLVMPYKNVANSMQGNARLMYRIGGKSKSSKPQISYIEREKIVERINERIVEKPVYIERTVKESFYDLIPQIHFEFDRDELTEESKKTVTALADLIKTDTSRRFLIIGHTDAKGSASYNEALSKRRAAALVDALIERGVPQAMLKSQGVGSKIAFMRPTAHEETRGGDRKVTIEVITNQAYWDALPKN